MLFGLFGIGLHVGEHRQIPKIFFLNGLVKLACRRLRLHLGEDIWELMTTHSKFLLEGRTEDEGCACGRCTLGIDKESIGTWMRNVMVLIPKKVGIEKLVVVEGERGVSDSRKLYAECVGKNGLVGFAGWKEPKGPVAEVQGH